MGALDVCPFIPVQDVSVEECVEISKKFGQKMAKGQLFSGWIYEVIVSPKMWTRNYQDFCPHYTGQKSCQFFVRIFGETMTS